MKNKEAFEADLVMPARYPGVNYLIYRLSLCL